MTNPNDGKNVMFFSQKKQFVIHVSAYAECRLSLWLTKRQALRRTSMKSLRLNTDGTKFRRTCSVTFAYYNTILTKKEEFFDEVQKV